MAQKNIQGIVLIRHWASKVECVTFFLRQVRTFWEVVPLWACTSLFKWKSVPLLVAVRTEGVFNKRHLDFARQCKFDEEAKCYGRLFEFCRVTFCHSGQWGRMTLAKFYVTICFQFCL